MLALKQFFTIPDYPEDTARTLAQLQQQSAWTLADDRRWQEHQLSEFAMFQAGNINREIPYGKFRELETAGHTLQEQAKDFSIPQKPNRLTQWWWHVGARFYKQDPMAAHQRAVRLAHEQLGVMQAQSEKSRNFLLAIGQEACQRIAELRKEDYSKWDTEIRKLREKTRKNAIELAEKEIAHAQKCLAEDDPYRLLLDGQLAYAKGEAGAALCFAQAKKATGTAQRFAADAEYCGAYGVMLTSNEGSEREEAIKVFERMRKDKHVPAMVAYWRIKQVSGPYWITELKECVKQGYYLACDAWASKLAKSDRKVDEFAQLKAYEEAYGTPRCRAVVVEIQKSPAYLEDAVRKLLSSDAPLRAAVKGHLPKASPTVLQRITSVAYSDERKAATETEKLMHQLFTLMTEAEELDACRKAIDEIKHQENELGENLGELLVKAIADNKARVAFHPQRVPQVVVCPQPQPTHKRMGGITKPPGFKDVDNLKKSRCRRWGAKFSVPSRPKLMDKAMDAVVKLPSLSPHGRLW